MSAATHSAGTVRSLARSSAPLITMGATILARKGMMKGYEARTGKKPPLVRSREATMVQKMLWAAAMAAVIVVVEAVVWNLLVDDEV